MADLAVKWLDLKTMEITNNAMGRYRSIIRNMLPRIGENRLASSVTHEHLLYIRKKLLTGYQTLKKGQTKPVKGRAVPTINNYMLIISLMFLFAVESGYITSSPFAGISPLKKSRVDPDPLTRDEFTRLIDACRHQQIKKHVVSGGLYRTEARRACGPYMGRY